jgi:hypothetical protein
MCENKKGLQVNGLEPSFWGSLGFDCSLTFSHFGNQSISFFSQHPRIS